MIICILDFAVVAAVVVRAKKHKAEDASRDELFVMDDLRTSGHRRTRLQSTTSQRSADHR